MAHFENLDFKKLTTLRKENDIAWIDLRFTDPKGKWQHLSMDADAMDEDMFEEGVMFDGSSNAGWKEINESDMILMPDLSTAILDPFVAQGTLVVFCDILDPSTGQAYNRDPRSTAKRAEEYLKFSGIGDTAYFGPEAEFFMFDDVRFGVEYGSAFYQLDDVESPFNSGREYEMGNLGHRPGKKGGYFPVAPVDSANDIRAEMVSIMKALGLPMDKHHHEVAPSQHELGMMYGSLTQTADRMQVYNTWCTRWPTIGVNLRPLCPNPSRAITAQACTFISQSGRAASPCLLAMAMRTLARPHFFISAALSSTPRH